MDYNSTKRVTGSQAMTQEVFFFLNASACDPGSCDLSGVLYSNTLTLNIHRTICFSGARITVAFGFLMLLCHFSVVLFEVECNSNGNRLIFLCAGKCIIVVSHLFWCVDRLTDTNGTVFS